MFLKVPNTEEEWHEIAIEFNDLWNFPNCVSAIDGKHVVIQAPANSGSEFYNYKGRGLRTASFCWQLVMHGIV